MSMTTIKERPILFSGPMVRALLDGRKTQTRRVVKPQPEPCNDGTGRFYLGPCRGGDPRRHIAALPTGLDLHAMACPYGVPGDRLWVKETMAWSRNEGQCTHGIQHPEEPPDLVYVADGATVQNVPDEYEPRRDTVSSIHMPRWASRITLEVVSVRVERVDDITEADAIAEGMQTLPASQWYPTWRDTFLSLFYDLNGRAPRGTNPWVWVVEFKRVEVSR
jgi:hypothetical protein